MSVGRQLDITVVEAQLVRIFDSLKPNQDVFVQLVCSYDDGSEKVVGRTEVCKNGNFHPRWNERFLCGRDAARGGKTLIFRVHVDHLWRNPVLCGEAEFGLDNLWGRASAGTQKVPVPIFKKGEQTGMLTITISLQDNSPVARPVRTSQATGFPDQPMSTQTVRPASLGQYPDVYQRAVGQKSVGQSIDPGRGSQLGYAGQPAMSSSASTRCYTPSLQEQEMRRGSAPVRLAVSSGQLPVGYQPTGAQVYTPADWRAAPHIQPHVYPFPASPGREQEQVQFPTTPTAFTSGVGYAQGISPGSRSNGSPGLSSPATAAASGTSGQWWNSFIDRG